VEAPRKRGGRWWKIALAVIGVVLVLAIAGVSLFFKSAMARPYPRTSGTVGGGLHTATFENQTLGQSGFGLIEDRFNRGA